ncbi:undecaprenyldiphospho-muramoylpentapeptide beta-N-acetylglucosaminyltransferase [Robertkochia sediminum]|uniref:undecaprenyldiphospho-muramoylpentapeptide beta-N-acetylglucosaminyltransferase n=1 Tax=Robertkochia sediminum TaxID=2785326 RepID=UPI00193279CA|nr:undecaprenyldiphospho-muramoylpentapeptide beta-N-acetylglucosaminyltransferase [Robertkochia sediminum]MBL7472475.1 undecaprenyldiphospho-muramoylpentapeptide beta-N-acetylglucosaminyltransferase [Robertkochia sediminum]
MSNYKFILSGGGTGGHIYPAIAIAKALQARYPQASFLFVGAKDKMEMEKVPQEGFDIKGLWISGIQRKLTLTNLMFPFKLISSLFRSRQIIKAFEPDLVVGTGGFASGPLLKMAASMQVPCVLQEQNSYPGITNKWLAPQAEKIFVAYDGLERFFPAAKIVKTGNPVRSDLLKIDHLKEEAMSYFDFESGKPVLFVMGGSLGAKRINELVAQHLDLFKELGVQVLWQCGKLYYEQYKHLAAEGVKVKPFISRMDLAYGCASVMISRAGASSVSELSIVGKPVLFIPSPNVAEDHQTKNAMAVVEKGAALMLSEKELDASFETVFRELITSKEQQQALGTNIRKMALPQATENIVDEIVNILNIRKNK